MPDVRKASAGHIAIRASIFAGHRVSYAEAKVRADMFARPAASQPATEPGGAESDAQEVDQ